MKNIPFREQSEVINGKPHFGIFFGMSYILYHHIENNDFMNDPIVLEILKKMEKNIHDLEMRNKSIIFRPSWGEGFFRCNATLGIKYILWGRAFKVMKFLKKGVKRYKKIIVSGKRKRVRYDH
jgi:hypothetical protein